MVPSVHAGARWSARLTPPVIVGIFGLATYIFVYRICVRFFIRERRRDGLVIGLLVLYGLLIVLTLASYARVVFAIQRDPGVVPLLRPRAAAPAPKAEKQRQEPWYGQGWWQPQRQRQQPRQGQGDPENHPWTPPDLDPDSPGLEAFYSKDVFACEGDGRPRWCSNCALWKPDRAHHSRELGFCIRKMDHFCPWVGGMVSETSFNFFAQFVFYTTCYCCYYLSITAYCLNQQVQGESESVSGWIVAGLILSAFFTLFAFGMTLTAGRYILTNTTNIDLLRKRQTFTLAVRIPRDCQVPPSVRTITYPIRRTEPVAPPGDGGAAAAPLPPGDAAETRDLQATHKFAILRAEPSENPWHLGWWANWKSVMGTNVLEWLLPLRHSPCCNHESMVSDYPFGPLLDDLKRRYNVPELDKKQSPASQSSSTGDR